jgi:hypothetical protein
VIARLIDPPKEEPVGREESRVWAKIDDDIDDVIIDVAIQAGREKAEHATGRRFIRQVWGIRVRAGETVSLHGLMPVISVKTAAGADVPWDDGLPATLTAAADADLRIECGYPDAKAVPASIKMWIWQRLGYLIEHRDALVSGQSVEPPRDYVDGLLDPYLVPRL